MSTLNSWVGVYKVMGIQSDQKSENTWSQSSILAIDPEARQCLPSISQWLFPTKLNKSTWELDNSWI